MLDKKREMQMINTDPLGACEVCWTNSWEPCEQAECDMLAEAHPHEGECVRCLCCWQQQVLEGQRAILAQHESLFRVDEQRLIDAGAVHLADEQTIRNIERELLRLREIEWKYEELKK